MAIIIFFSFLPNLVLLYHYSMSLFEIEKKFHLVKNLKTISVLFVLTEEAYSHGGLQTRKLGQARYHI
jgi:hypothetical protein